MLKKGIATIFRANVISLIIGLLTSFLLPKFLQVETYAAIKSFQFYITYIGFLHLGYADGMYLNYGGVSSEKIDKREVASDIITMKAFQMGISTIFIVISLCCGSCLGVAFALSIVPLNMTSYFKLLWQATGEFKKYSRIMNVSTLVVFMINVILLMRFQASVDYKVFIGAYVIVYVVIYIWCERSIEKTFNISRTKGGFSFVLLGRNIYNGFLLMLGNFSAMILTGMDRWFVKVLMDAVAFAQYSFAISIENFMNIVITPISVTLYNFFCRQEEKEEIKKVCGILHIVAVVLLTCAFPARWIVEKFLYQYINSVTVIFLLFASQIFSIPVRCIYINMYKAHRLQNRYFLKLVSVIMIGLVLNVLFYSIKGIKESFALGTFISNIVWYFLSVIDFKEVCPGKYSTIYLLSEATLFLISGMSWDSVTGFAVYLIGTVGLTMIFMCKYVKEAFLKLRCRNY